MDFQRARSDEQKNKRIEQLTDVAEELLDSFQYKEITLDMIAKELGFSRANISRYASTKEEIFLLVYVRQFEMLADDVAIASSLYGKMDFKTFGQFVANACMKYENFLKIGSILNSIIELNIDAERLAEYKKRMFACLNKLNVILMDNFHFLDAELSQRCLMDMSAYLSGLYPMLNLTPTQIRAIELAGAEPRQFMATKDAISSFVIVLLNGYQALGRDANDS